MNDFEQDYVLGPEDEIAIHAAEMEALSYTPLRSASDGTIKLPMLGKLKQRDLRRSNCRSN